MDMSITKYLTALIDVNVIREEIKVLTGLRVDVSFTTEQEDSDFVTTWWSIRLINTDTGDCAYANEVNTVEELKSELHLLLMGMRLGRGEEV